MIIVYQY